jgi:hypothetical protein
MKNWLLHSVRLIKYIHKIYGRLVIYLSLLYIDNAIQLTTLPNAYPSHSYMYPNNIMIIIVDTTISPFINSTPNMFST